MVKPSRFAVYLTNLNPTTGAEIKKRRPCVIISPDEMNQHLRTIIIAPMTSKGFDFPTRVRVRFSGKDGFILLDQIRTIDKSRLGRRLGAITPDEKRRVIALLQEMFAA